MDHQARYEAWRNAPELDETTRQALLALADNPKELEDCFYRELDFGTAGLRGILGPGPNRMNAYVVRRATQGLAEYLLGVPDAAQRGVAIAFDSRRCSAEFALETALVLCANGVKTYLFESLRAVPSFPLPCGI